MSLANKLLNSLDTTNENTIEEPHIVIGKDRFITVPDSLKRLAVQYDHNIETVTFDCPRYWDEHDMSTMVIYINYLCADKETGCYRAENVTVDTDDSNIMHFDWTISKNLTMAAGQIAFLVCVKNTNSDGTEKNHWNSEICKDCYVSSGMEYDGSAISEIYPDILEQWHKDVLSITDEIVAARDNGEFQGEPGVSPTIQVTDIDGGHRVTITDINGVNSFDVMDTIVDGTEAVNALFDNFIYTGKGITAHTEDGVTYEATVDSITELKVGTSFVMIPDNSNSTVHLTIFLNVNNLGAKPLVRKTNISTGSTYSGSDIRMRSEWLDKDRPVRVTYNGDVWVADQVVVSASNLNGTLPIVSGGTGGASISKAADNLKFNSLAYATDYSNLYNLDVEIPVGKYYFNKNDHESNGDKEHNPSVDSLSFPFISTSWTYFILTVEDAEGKGHLNSSDNPGVKCHYRQTLLNDQFEKFSREIVFIDGECIGSTEWIQHHNSRTPIVLSDNSYGTSLPLKGTIGQVYFLKGQGCYIYTLEISGESGNGGWVKYL